MTTQGELPDIVELLPCPFCGGRAEIERRGTAKQSCIIACEDCGCRLETGEIWNMGECWNTRATPPGSPPDTQPRVTDDDKDSITVTFNGRELRGWSYASDAERRVKMTAAREYVEGWCDGRDAR